MPRPFQRPVIGKRVRGLMYFKQLKPLFARLRRIGIERDRAGNRKLFYDQYVGLILLFFFNPTFRSLRALQRASCMAQVRKKLKCSRTSLGSLSEAARVFDADALQSIIGELAQQALPLNKGKDAEILRGLTAVDGTLLPALPKMAWALWIDETHRAAKLHLHFDVFKGVPCHASVTAGNGNERDELRAALQSGRLYAIDRGYAEYQLFQDIIDARSSFIGRIRDNAVYQLVEERTLSDDALAADVLWDRVVWLGGEQSGAVLKQKLRVVAVATGKTDSHGQPEVLLLASNCLDLDAAWIALGYRFRWTIELFFRWFKCILGCQHLLSTCPNGVAIQVYMALIASMVMVLWTGHKPNKATLEMLSCYFTGLASDAELMAHLRSLDEPKKKKS
ncbi:MAG TPA: IS4 family transposase [Candidatus Limnocylindria bacterium]|nr:IS4 family transposase [Candidatus Limnocylindria bacterium]